MSLADVSANTAYKIIGGYGVYSCSLPIWWNVQTTTTSFVDKRRPWKNGVPDQHVGNKLSFQVNWTLWINSIALSSSDHPSSIHNHWSIRSGFLLSPQCHVFQGVHLQKCSEVLRCLESDTFNHFQTPPRSSAQRCLLQHYERSGFPLSPQLEKTSKPRRNHLLIQADRAYGTEISPRSFVISFVILLYAISYNICT
jgi:hypothetical protein